MAQQNHIYIYIWGTYLYTRIKFPSIVYPYVFYRPIASSYVTAKYGYKYAIPES